MSGPGPRAIAQRRVVIGIAALGAAAALVAIVLLFTDLRDVVRLVAGADRRLLAILVGLAVVDHLVRFARWHLLMQRVAHARLALWRGLVAYLAGGTLIFTPARVGEVARSTYASQLLGVRVPVTLPILLAERVADVCVMAALATAGLILAGKLAGNWLPLAAAAALTLLATGGLIVLIRYRPRVQGRWWSSSAIVAGESSRELVTGRPIALNLGLGLVAWLIEVVIYAMAITSLDASPTSPVFVAALAVFPLASLIGAISLVPGGLGATEGSLAALGTGLAGLSIEASLASALLARAAILIVVVALGVPSTLAVVALSRKRSPRAGDATAP